VENNFNNDILQSRKEEVMKLNIKIDNNFDEPETLITTSKMTDEINKIVDFVSKLENVATVITGIKDDKVELLEQEFLVRIYTEDGKVFARTENDLYLLRLRLYELEERLDSTTFVRISNSEIVNLKKVKSLDLNSWCGICWCVCNLGER
jgi:DNA-binding LytR/AlgR family response regulator